MSDHETVERVRGLHDRLVKSPNDRAHYFAGLLRCALEDDLMPQSPAPQEGDRVRLTYGDGSFVEGTWRAVLELDDGTLHTHTRGQVRRDVIARYGEWTQ